MFFFLILIICVVSGVADTGLLQTLSKEGLDAKISICVVDQSGNAVSNANVKFSFGFSTGKKSNIVESITDQFGHASALNKTNSRIVIQVYKEGYYRTGYRYGVWKGRGGYEKGRWEPWNPTITVVLYKILCPKKIVEKSYTFDGLMANQPYAFDFITGSIYPADSVTNDIDLVFDTSGNFFSPGITWKDDYSATNRFVFLAPGSGIIEKSRNNNSTLLYEYQAPLEGYTRNIDYIYEQKNRESIEIRGFPSQTDHYLVFKISRKSDNEEANDYYGVIEYWGIGKDWKTGKICFYISYRLNPVPGDRNIEYN